MLKVGDRFSLMNQAHFFEFRHFVNCNVELIGLWLERIPIGPVQEVVDEDIYHVLLKQPSTDNS